jgi:hypothetical protein
MKAIGSRAGRRGCGIKPIGTFLYIFFNIIYLFIHLSIYLFIYLFIFFPPT